MAALVIAPLLLAAPALASERTPPLLQQQARSIAVAELATWTCQDQLPRPRWKYTWAPWALPKSTGYRAEVLQLWRTRLAGCRAVLHERARQWNWQAWLPDKWQRIGACETGYGQRPGNWRHNSGAFQGAFGFRYTSWDDFRLPGYPTEAYLATPWQQYQVALAIYHRYGFSGWGCRGA